MTEVPLHIPRDHPAYAGHFPGNPILPAVVLLSEVLAIVESSSGLPMNAWSVANAKFHSAVTPGSALTLTHESTSPHGIRFEIRSERGVVASGTLSAR